MVVASLFSLIFYRRKNMLCFLDTTNQHIHNKGKLKKTRKKWRQRSRSRARADIKLAHLRFFFVSIFRVCHAMSLQYKNSSLRNFFLRVQKHCFHSILFEWLLVYMYSKLLGYMSTFFAKEMEERATEFTITSASQSHMPPRVPICACTLLCRLMQLI